MQLKTIKTNLLLLLMGFVLAFMATEVLLRFYNPFQFRVKGNKIRLPVYFHYKFELTNVKRLEKVVSHTKNSLGFRGEERPEDFEKYLTIVTVGGSTTESFIITDGKAWPALAGEKIKGRFKNVWLNNAGLDGHSTFGHIVLMKDFVVKLKPKVVLFLVGINDLWLKDSQRFDAMLTSDLTLNLDSIKGFFRTMGNHSEVFALAYNLYRFSKKIHYPYTDSPEIKLKEVKTLELKKSDEQEIIRGKIKEFKEKYEKNYSLRLEKLIKLSRENNILPVLITQPALYGDVVDDVTKVNLGAIMIEKGKNGKIAWESLELYNKVVREVGLEQNVMVVDLANEMPKSSKYFYDYIHFNNEGSEKVAEIVSRNLQPVLKKKFSDYSTE